MYKNSIEENKHAWVFGCGVWECHNPGTAEFKDSEDTLKCPAKGPVEINGTAEKLFKGHPELDVEACT